MLRKKMSNNELEGVNISGFGTAGEAQRPPLLLKIYWLADIQGLC
jgi:hypothetical protein